MGILSGLFKSRDKPTNRTNGPVIHLLLCEGLRFMGSMKVGDSVNNLSQIYFQPPAYHR